MNEGVFTVAEFFNRKTRLSVFDGIFIHSQPTRGEGEEVDKKKNKKNKGSRAALLPSCGPVQSDNQV